MKYDAIKALESAGISNVDATALRRISMTLHRWHELECGDGHGCIERDETTGKPYWHNSFSGRKSSIADREAGAIKRLKAIFERYPSLGYYIQGDPRGAALYVLRPGDIPTGATADSCYSRGIVVCQ